MKKSNLLILGFLLLSLGLFCGCSKATELRDRAIVQAMGIDYDNGEYKIILQEYLPERSKSATEGEGGENIYVTSKGKTLFDALKNAQVKDGNEVFYGHSRVYLIGEKAAEQGLVQITEFMNSNYQLSLNSAVMLTEGSAEQIMQKRIFKGTVPDISVSRIEGSGKALDTSVIDLLRDTYNINGSCSIPLITSDGKDEIKIENCVIFKENKPEIKLNSLQTMGYIWLEGKIKDAVMTTKETDRKISINVVSDNTKLKLKTQGEQITLSVNVKAKGNVSEIGIIHNQAIDEEKIKEVENEITRQIEEQINKAFEKIVDEGKCDILNIRQLLKNTDKNLYNKLRDEKTSDWIGKVTLETKVDFTIRHSGVQVR